jgi:hypothetical protein
VIDSGTGNRTVLSGAGDSARLQGTDGELDVRGDGALISLTGTSSKATIAGDNASIVDSGTGDRVVLRGDNESINVSGSNDHIVSTGCGNAITVSGSGDTVDASNASITVGDGVTTSVHGRNDSISLGTGATLTLTGKLNDVLHVASADDSDTLVLGSVNHGKLWFAQSNEDLVISVIGRQQSVTIADWFDAPDSHVGTLQTADGFSISDAGIDQLVQAMAAFPPPGGHSHISQGEAATLAPVLAANWQHS